MTRFITPEGKIKAEKELEELKETRPQIAERICSAKELGDLSENAEYSTAKEDLAKTESRIRDLQDLLRNAKIIEHKESDCVEIGSKVKIKIGEQKKEYILVGKEETDPSQGFISYESPLGMALLGKRVGNKIKIQTPKGDNLSAEIIDVK